MLEFLKVKSDLRQLLIGMEVRFKGFLNDSKSLDQRESL